MTNNFDAQIAREWALRAVESAENTQPVSRGALAAARHILATTTPPTMDNIDWDDEVHTGLCALYANGDLVRMLGPDLDNKDGIICHWVHYDSPVTGRLLAEHLTPLPGTKIDLTPLRAPVSNEGVETGNENRNEGVMTGNNHPVVLSSVEDYEAAPVGTVVEYDGDVAVKRNDGQWQWTGRISRFWSEDFAEGDPSTVVRWGK